MSNKPCWYKRDAKAKWECGFFHQWSVNYDEFETGPGSFAAAIVEDAATEECHVVYAGHVSFSNDPPEGEEFVEKEKIDWLLGINSKVVGRFKPRLVWVAHFNQWLVQVHPEAIEVFDDNADFVCQVRCIRGKMNYTYQGSLPLAQLEDMFKETP